MAKRDKNWIDALIEREALPKSVREDTIETFCKKWGVDESTYQYQRRKKENWEKILEISLNSAKRETPEILKVLNEKAKGGDMKAIDMFLNYVLKLAKNLDLKSDGKPLPILNLKDNAIQHNNSDNKDNEAKKED